VINDIIWLKAINLRALKTPITVYLYLLFFEIFSLLVFLSDILLFFSASSCSPYFYLIYHQAVHLVR
jgi:hypothetical protein